MFGVTDCHCHSELLRSEAHVHLQLLVASCLTKERDEVVRGTHPRRELGKKEAQILDGELWAFEVAGDFGYESVCCDER